jgi:hypothetical protein
MSMLSLRRGDPKQTEPPMEYRPPRPQPPGPHQLGDVMLRAVDEISAASAEQWEKLADAVLDAAHQMAERYSEVARLQRHQGLMENERLANLVREASTSYDAAEMLLERFTQRDQLQPEPPAEVHGPPKPVDLDAIAEQIAEVKVESGQ